MPGPVNADGTTQVAPSTQSAFAPQPGQPAPAPLAQALGPPQAPPGSPDPGSFAGALMALIHSLASSFAPKSITQAKARTDQNIASQE
jgi:hypothetical protein